MSYYHELSLLASFRLIVKDDSVIDVIPLKRFKVPRILRSQINVLQTAVHLAQARADDQAVVSISKDGHFGVCLGRPYQDFVRVLEGCWGSSLGF